MRWPGPVIVPGLLAATLAIVTPGLARAALITFDFAGTVSSVNSALAPTFSTGQTITGSYTFESTTPDVIGGVPFSGYLGANTALTFIVGSYAGTFGTVGFNAISVSNDSNGEDRYQVTIPFVGSAVNGNSPVFFALDLLDNIAPLIGLSSTALPLTSPSLDGFNSNLITLNFGAPSLVASPHFSQVAKARSFKSQSVVLDR